MNTQITGITEVQDATNIVGGDYVETTLGLICGLAFGAGVIGSGGLLAVACGIGAGLIIYEEL